LEVLLAFLDERNDSGTECRVSEMRSAISLKSLGEIMEENAAAKEGDNEKSYRNPEAFSDNHSPGIIFGF
jgi:hypothetical protein